ncbi:MAG: hypothetical protein DRR06_15700 [Gammaproteobacteria bacterium]|nr:MAG: hypothetical protein DRR06_15700 [Gammaproteobacteria bacterium]
MNIEGEWTTRGGYEIVAGPIERPMDCKEFVVLNDDGHMDQFCLVKVFPDGQVSKRDESPYDLINGSDDDHYYECPDC